MALILKKMLDGYHYAFNELADPRVKNYFMMSSPLIPIALIIVYLRFVKSWGPKFMEKRPPFQLNRVLLVYNFIQIVLNAFIVQQSFKCFVFRYRLACEPIDFSVNDDNLHITRMTWLYYMLKVADLLDTVFFVLRKKHNQITFLHLYHHCGMVALTWFGVKFLAGGMSLYLGLINAIVHTVMYSYYFVSAWNPEQKKNIWWKKHITQLQIIQFLFLIILYGQLFFKNSCDYPQWVAYIFVPQNLFMLVLFCDFYYKAYIKPNKSKAN